MNIKKAVFKQFGKPTGVLGKFAGHYMALNNLKRSNWTIEKLNFKPTDTILEIGYGPGVTLKKIAEKLTTGYISGIDHSSIMMQQAIKRNKENIKNNKVDLRCGTINETNYPKEYFDIIYGSNVHFFWNEPVEEFKRLNNFLKDSGRLIFVFQPRYLKSNEKIKSDAERTRAQFLEAGFKNIEIDFKEMEPIDCIFISGQK